MCAAPEIDPVALAQDLIRCPSVTPEDAGALAILERALGGLGFTCHRLRFSESGTPDVENLYARRGDRRPVLCFAGHVDVVPPGDEAAWSVPPFAGEIRDGKLHGRGAVDMKGEIAAFVAATARFLAEAGDDFGGSIAFLITGDEEGPAINGTPKLLHWLEAHGETLDHCLVGEPSNRTRLDETVKIGRRGSLNGRLRVFGTQGHAAYPQHADNPIPRLMRMLDAIAGQPLDDGTEHFESTIPQITSIDVGNPVTNVIPGEARAAFNIRFNDRHTGDGLKAWIEERCAAVGGRFELDFEVSGESFLTPPGPWTEIIVEAVAKVTGQRPALDTGGGTSDARFIKDVCPVAEYGLGSTLAHRTDEHVQVTDLRTLSDIYRHILKGYFETPPC